MHILAIKPTWMKVLASGDITAIRKKHMKYVVKDDALDVPRRLINEKCGEEILLKDIIINVITDKTYDRLHNKSNFCELLSGKEYYPKTIRYNGECDIDLEDEMWFLKPNVSHSGIGMHVIKSSDEFPKISNDYTLQRAIEPMLFQGYKFDLRMYLIVTYFSDELEFYLSNDSQVRVASLKYDKNDTNKAIQFTHVPFLTGKNIGTVLSELPDYKDMFGKIKTLFSDMCRTMRTLHTKYTSDYKLEYQLCGPDIIFDKDLNPYILELNAYRPTYIVSNDSDDVRIFKTKIGKSIKEGLIESVYKHSEIRLEQQGFLKIQ